MLYVRGYMFACPTYNYFEEEEKSVFAILAINCVETWQKCSRGATVPAHLCTSMNLQSRVVDMCMG